MSLLHHLGRVYSSNRLLLFCYFLLLAAVLGRGVHYGFTGDETGYVVLNTEEFASHPLLPIITNGVDTGHPMLYVYPVAVWWRLFGRSNAAANVATWIWATIALVALHRLLELVLARSAPKRRVPRWAGPAAALALFSTPMFISLSAQLLDPVPYTALLLCLVLAWATGRRRALTVLACMVPLVRITACFSVLGLGLYDLGYAFFVLRRRSWRELARTMAPYMISGAVFCTYLFVKLVVLKRPMSTLEANKFMIGSPEQMRTNAGHVLAAMLQAPRYGFTLLLAAAGAGVLVTLVRRWRKGAGAGNSTGDTPRAAAIYGACIATMIVPNLYYCIHPYFPQPRYMLPWHAWLALAGVHGLLVLTGRRAVLFIPVLALWCGLQVTRWHNHWMERCLRPIFPKHYHHFRLAREFSLDAIDRKGLNHKAAEWMKKRGNNAAIFCAYPTRVIFMQAAAGYIEPQKNTYLIHPASPWYFNDVLKREGELYVVQASWDLRREMMLENAMMNDYPFKVVFLAKAKSGEWIKIFHYRRNTTKTRSVSR